MLNIEAETTQVESAAVTPTTDQVMLPEYPGVDTGTAVPHAAFVTASRIDCVMAPPLTDPQGVERSTPGSTTPPEQRRNEGQGSCVGRGRRELLDSERTRPFIYY